MASRGLRLVLAAASFAIAFAAEAQYVQQVKLIATGTLGPAGLGSSVALSADGSTAIVGGALDNANGAPFGDGAAWIWVRSGALWVQQAKLADPAAVGTLAGQGDSVALSADGNTALVGGATEIGSVRVWVRSGSSWTLQADLVGTGTTGAVAFQGISVALSADGNTALLGGPLDGGGSATTYGIGAAWVFTRSDSVWTQQGPKLVGSGAVGASDQGISVALSADGNTALVGGDQDDPISGGGWHGATWVYLRNGGIWTQQGPKLTGTPVAGTGGFGSSVALSSDGNTAVIGAHDSVAGIGGFFGFTRSGGVWTQQGFPQFGSDFAGATQQGLSIALSGDGNTALLGGPEDAGGPGAVWAFNRSGGAWTQQGAKIVGTGAVGSAQQGWSVALSTDGLTALMGGPVDDSRNGAAWILDAAVAAITLQPASIGACAGSSVTFSVGTASWPVASVQWQVSTNGGSIFNNIPGAISSLYSLTTTSLLNGNQYRAIATNSLGTTTSAAGSLTISTAPAITVNPTSLGLNSGQTATFIAAATGTPAPTIQWYASLDGGVSFKAISGATSTILSFTATPVLNGALYAAVFTTPCSTAQSTAASLTVSAPPAPPAVTTQPAGLSVCPGQGGTLTQFLQQGPLLVGTDGSNGAGQGISVALSGDGNTALVGGHQDNSDLGAVWVYVRSGGSWAQQGPKLVGSGTGTLQGFSVALSSDGNTALVGGWGSYGSAWVWTRSGGTWSQQGPPLPYPGAVPNPQFGFSVALSGDGNTAAVGANYDNGLLGSVYIYVRSGSTWTRQGPGLTGTGGVGGSTQGDSVALSSDGNTLLVGGSNDNGSLGAVWVFTRSGSVWAQQGSKLVGAGSSASGNQGGYHVALSADGGTAAWGTRIDTAPAGIWIFTRGPNAWSQQGPKLVPADAVGGAATGASIALSGNGNTALIGGNGDSGGIGAAWIFTRKLGVWTQEGAKLVGTAPFFETGFFPPLEGTSVAMSGDGTTAIVGGVSGMKFPALVITGQAWIFAKGQVSFTAAASGAPAPTVQWQASTDGGATFHDIAGANSNALTVAAVASSNGEQFRAVFTNSDGISTSSAATFTVHSAPVVTADPSIQIRNPSQTATFTAAASGSPAPGVQWQSSAQGLGPFIDIAGATSTTLNVTVTSALIGSRFRAVFTNGCGTATSAEAILATQVALSTASSPTAGGTVSPPSGSLYDPGTVVTVQATPASGYVFTGWIGPVTSPQSASTTVTVNGPTTVTANFAPASETTSIPALGASGLFAMAALLALGGGWLLASRGAIGV